MSYQIDFIPKDGYLHIKVTGQNTRENAVKYLDEILTECKSRKCERILIEEDLSGPRLGIADVFEIAAKASLNAIGVMKSLAYVDVNAKDDTMKFAETVGVNRGMPARVFSTIGEAESWMIGRVEAARAEKAEGKSN
jgi:hypothetical protein